MYNFFIIYGAISFFWFRKKHENTPKVRHFRNIRKRSPTVTRRITERLKTFVTLIFNLKFSQYLCAL